MFHFTMIMFCDNRQCSSGLDNMIGFLTDWRRVLYLY